MDYRRGGSWVSFLPGSYRMRTGDGRKLAPVVQSREAPCVY